MKKKIEKKLNLNKLTISTLNAQMQLKIKGGETCWPTCQTQACGTCVTCPTCETCISECGGSCRPTICENTCPLACPD